MDYMDDHQKERKPVDILIVEDSKTQALLLEEIIRRHNYTSKWVPNGNAAIDFLANQVPKLVISDVVMPEMDGYELAKKIKEKINLPIILLTALANPDDILKGLQAGADNFLTKPVDEELLISRIKYVLMNNDLRKKRTSDLNFDLYFSGKRYQLNSDRLQILDLLLSTYEIVHKQKIEFERLNNELYEALSKVRKLEGILPICSMCKNIRDDKGYWKQVEIYVEENSDTEFTHGYCPDCKAEMLVEIEKVHGARKKKNIKSYDDFT